MVNIPANIGCPKVNVVHEVSTWSLWGLFVLWIFFTDPNARSLIKEIAKQIIKRDINGPWIPDDFLIELFHIEIKSVADLKRAEKEIAKHLMGWNELLGLHAMPYRFGYEFDDATVCNFYTIFIVETQD